jgi:hypothetical protein
MRLDRNTTNPKRGKYALIKLRECNPVVKKNKWPWFCAKEVVMVPRKAVDLGDTPDSEFFVIRLKDKYAQPALEAYAMAARADGEQEYANEVAVLAIQARNHKSKRKPD